MERWFRSLRAELTDRTLIWNRRHLMRLLREPDNVIDLDTSAPAEKIAPETSSTNITKPHRISAGSTRFASEDRAFLAALHRCFNMTV